MDIAGEKFGKLIVLEEYGRDKRGSILWKCKCSCGKLTTATTYNLRSGHKRSCGCLRTGVQPEDLSGHTFGRLLVKEYKKTDKWRTTHWLCKCRCNNEVIISRSSLLNGLTKSCGCLNKENGINKLKEWRKTQKFLTKEEKVYNRYLCRIRNRYGITKEEYEKMINDQNNVCVICNNKDKLVVDHDHITGHVRGLLCNNCNRGLGSFKDNVQILDAAIVYLKGKKCLKLK